MSLPSSMLYAILLISATVLAQTPNEQPAPKMTPAELAKMAKQFQSRYENSTGDNQEFIKDMIKFLEATKDLNYMTDLGVSLGDFYNGSAGNLIPDMLSGIK